MKSHFKLFASCIPVKGSRRSAIYDLQRRDIYLISNGLYSLLTEYTEYSLEEIFENHDDELVDVIKRDVDFLVENEIGFLTSEPERFPPLNLQWKTPAIFTNAIITYSNDSKYNLAKTFKELASLRCKYMELRLHQEMDESFINDLFLELEETSIIYVNILFKFKDDINIDYLCSLLNRFSRIEAILVHSAPEDIQIQEEHAKLKFTTQKILDNSHCGNVSTSHFAISNEMFTESSAHNNCLNKKIAIDENGLVSNCPGLPKKFGHIETVNIKELPNNSQFSKFWNVSKDKIKVCRDCEFRYACNDCRVYTENNDELGKPSKCNYDPYSAQWSDSKRTTIDARIIDRN